MPKQGNKELVVAIDGPSGAGKSSVGKRLAKSLGYRYIDTGAIYRSVALVALEAGVDWGDEPGLSRLVGGLSVDFEWHDGENRVSLGGRDRTGEIRSERMGMGASRVSGLAGVRAGLLELQRGMGAAGGIVMDGRDIGTVVFPDAEVKFFLTADSGERARRRFNELLAQGVDADLGQVARDLATRDRQDSEREMAPLRAAEDAVAVDSTGRTIDEIVALMKAHVDQVRRANCDEAKGN